MEKEFEAQLTTSEKILVQTEKNIAYYAAHPEKINKRLEQLDHEWDIERTLEANASALTLTSLVLGTVVNRRWFYVPAILGGFMLQNAITGWCPPLPLFRKLGVRTQIEIERERYALKALRGDFNRIIEHETTTKGNIVYLSKKIISALTGEEKED